jgi:hypothetical protein
MTEQTEALRLAECLERDCEMNWPDYDNQMAAAAELRRLQAMCGEWENKAATWLASPEAARRLDGYRELAQRLNAAESVNAQLLEALEEAADDIESWGAYATEYFQKRHDLLGAVNKARAAIAAAKGEA